MPDVDDPLRCPDVEDRQVSDVEEVASRFVAAVGARGCADDEVTAVEVAVERDAADGREADVGWSDGVAEAGRSVAVSTVGEDAVTDRVL